MRGVELSPASALVRPAREAMFVSYDVSGPIKGLLVGVRRTELDDWRPAIGAVTVTAVVSRGLRLPVRAWQDFTHDEIAWAVNGSACAPFCVYVRNDGREMVELRAVVVLQGDGDRGAGGRRRLRSSRLPHEPR